MQGYGAPAGGPPGQIRNPIMVLLITAMCGCLPYGMYQCMKIQEELNRYLGKNEGGSVMWFLFPLLPTLAMPKLIAEARAKAGTATQGEPGLLGYLFLGFYLFPKDANEIWERLGVRAS